MVCLIPLACTNRLTNTGQDGRFKHNFQQGTADNLYNIFELLGKDPVLDSEEKAFSPPPAGEPSVSPSDIPLKPIFKYPPLSSTGGYPKSLLRKGIRSHLLKIRTVKKGQKATVSFVQENIHIDPKISFINEYEFLDYRIPNTKKNTWHSYIAQLLGQIGHIRKFKGFPQTDYYILPLLVGNYLVLYKVGPPDKIPYDELPLARRVEDMLAVPLVGYPIKYCIAEVIPDVNERETGQYRPKCEGIRLQYAEYIQLDESRKKVFQYKDKLDLFPRDFFALSENERKKYNWFHVRTVVKSPENKYVGHQLFQPANLVEFHPAHRKLDVLDASGSEIKSADKIRALFIPVEWTDYQIKRDSENLHPEFSEEIVKDIPDENLRYFKIRFEDLVENEIKFKGEKTLKNVFITDNYLSFNVEITGKNTGAYLVKFAFFKKSAEESANYIPKKWFEEDSTLFFPSFSEKRNYYESSLDHSHADHDRFLRTTRFNPKAKEIEWYFSKQTPNDPENQWVREMGRLALDLMNKALQEAGKDSDHEIKITLDETGADKEVGDIRYNILNLIVSEGKTDGGLLGRGPNVANPITGEVVSATANVWVSNVLGIYIGVVKRYIRFHVYPPAWTMRPFSKEVTASLQKRIDEKTPKCGDLYLKPLGSTPFLHEQIKNSCSEVTDFIRKQQINGVTYDPENPDVEDKKIIKSCARKIAYLPILGVTLHEILHGFAQRHIFSASIDTENFYRSYDEIKKIFGNLVSDEIERLFGNTSLLEGTKCHPNPPKYSSVMDYMNLYNPILFVPGKLDIAALRFIYFDKVDLKKGKGRKGRDILEIPSGADRDPNNPQKSILQAALDEGYRREDLKNYKVLCGGDRIEGNFYRETDPNQPLCKKFDYGVNPLEIAINSILQTHDSLINRRNRYDSQNILSHKNRYFVNYSGDLYIKWKQYRDELLNQKGTSIENYSFVNPEQISQYEQIITEEQANSSDFRMYYDIRQPIFDYFKRLAFMPVKHCVYEKESHTSTEPRYSAVAFENILAEEKGNYAKYPENSKARFISCQSPVAQDWAEENKRGKLVAEVGFLSDLSKYFLRPKGQNPTDERSAFTVLYKMLVDSDDPIEIFSKEFTSPFFDIVLEPDLGAEYYQELRAYMLQGTDLNPYVNETLSSNVESIRLNRVLSYKTDEKILSSQSTGAIALEGIIKSRFAILEDAIDRLKTQATNGELASHFDWEPRKRVDIGRTAQLIESHGDYPFFTQAYSEYNNHPERSFQGGSFASFIKDHPATLYNRSDSSFLTVREKTEIGSIKDPDGIFYKRDDSSLIMVPYTGEDKSFPAQLFRRFNAFADCIENQNKFGIICDDVEEKQAFMRTVLTHYYETTLEDQQKDSTDDDESDSDEMRRNSYFKSFPEQLLRRFNEFADCIENQNKFRIICDDIEGKQVFMRTFLTHYYETALKDQQKDFTDYSESDSDEIRNFYLEFERGIAQ